MDTSILDLQSPTPPYEMRSVWSVGEVFNLDEVHPFKGIHFLKYTDSDNKSIDVVIPGPRWFDLYIAAESAILLSKDQARVCIEEFLAFDEYLELKTGA